MSDVPRTVSLATLNTLPVDDFSQHLGNVYEHASWVAATAAAARPFATIVALY
jgi:2-oxo-4-hydroxy-4-carboxy-5-ureidoimidazoline decarboxylase